MADQKTAAEWRGASDALKVQKTDVQKQIAETTRESLRLIKERDNLLIEQANVGLARQAEISRDVDSLNKKILNNQNYTDRLRTTDSEINQSINIASLEQETALDSPIGTRANPVTHSNPPPVDDIARENASLLGRYPPPVNDIARENASLLGRYPPPGVAGDTTASPEPPFDAATQQTRASAPEKNYVPFPEAEDYRVRISLSPNADYLYMDPTIAITDILYPLSATRGVIFPYVPSITVVHTANYAPTELTHSNYKTYNYISSGIDTINIVADFTAQDIGEANYVLAVTHFFKSVTKMFYGQDQRAGVPPPLVYLSGHGEYAFNNHPMVITAFTMTYPQDVDYVNAGPLYNQNISFNSYKSPSATGSSKNNRLRAAKLNPGGISASPQFSYFGPTNSGITRIPTKLNLQITAYPIVTRFDISNNFSLKEYATGKLLKGNQNSNGKGYW